MKFIFFTISGEGLPIAYRLQQEGNDVIVGQVKTWKELGINEKETPEETEKRLRLYDGLLEKVDAKKLLKVLDKVKNKDEYFVVCDFNYLWRYSVQLRKMGFKGLLPHHTDFLLEKDREKAKKLVEKWYPTFAKEPHFEFSKIEEAIKFLDEHKDEIDEENYNQIINELKEKKSNYEKEGLVLEKKIVDIVEFTPKAIAFDGEILGTNIDIENKPVGAGNTGENTVCAMDVVFWIDNEEIFERFLKPLWDNLYSKRRGELIVWDASVFYSPQDDKFYFGEYCPRPGYNAWFTELSTMPFVTEYFERIVKKEPLFTPSTKRIGASVRLFDLNANPQKPLEKSRFNIDVNFENKNVWILDVYKDDNKLFATNYTKDVAVVTGAGDSLPEAVDECYSQFATEPSSGFVLKGYHPDAPTIVPAPKGDISFPEMYYRPKFDFVSFGYQTSIPNRLQVLKELFDLDIDIF